MQEGGINRSPSNFQPHVSSVSPALPSLLNISAQNSSTKSTGLLKGWHSINRVPITLQYKLYTLCAFLYYFTPAPKQVGPRFGLNAVARHRCARRCAGRLRRIFGRGRSEQKRLDALLLQKFGRESNTMTIQIASLAVWCVGRMTK